MAQGRAARTTAASTTERSFRMAPRDTTTATSPSLAQQAAQTPASAIWIGSGRRPRGSWSRRARPRTWRRPRSGFLATRLEPSFPTAVATTRSSSWSADEQCPQAQPAFAQAIDRLLLDRRATAGVLERFALAGHGRADDGLHPSRQALAGVLCRAAVFRAAASTSLSSSRVACA